eukprot:TRINITY_DN3850_c0_g2_i1.p1 TRINITY_DN3850_c0_g2~~TRINITY_DN3850_c0_g2_i1.p1  ORF type:complete len:135 (+),score=27.02 TRINITY_DN3850_c0_g2_i1:95-499(+)
MIQNEVKYLINLQSSEHIVKLLDVKKTASATYLFTEYCDGGDLEAYQRKFEISRVPVPEIRKIMKDVLKGFEDIVRNNIIHRNLRHESIVLSGDKWKISDFSFSEQSEDELKNFTIIGTPLYMAPQLVLSLIHI